MKPFGVVYLIWNMVNGRRYVGQTVQTLETRFKGHANCKTTAIGKAIRKYGVKNFRYGVIKSCASKEEMDYWEKYFIVALHSKTPYGYNCTDGGEGTVGVERSPETRAKLSAASATHCGEKNSFFGKHHTDETRAKISAKKKGTHHTKETRAKMSEKRKGVPKSPETRAKLSAAKTGVLNHRYGKKNSPEHQAKIVAANTGAKRTPETCRNISEALKGKPFTIERCAHISAAKRGDSPYKNLIAELDVHNLSFQRLAELLGLAQSIVSRKMHDIRNFTARDAANLEKIFGKPAGYLLQRTE